MSEGLSFSPASRLYLLRLAFAELNSSLNGNNIHAVLAQIYSKSETTKEMKKILKAYLSVATELKEQGCFGSEIKNTTSSALFELKKSEKVGLFALFGGQGVNWLEELRTNYDVYVDVRDVIEKAAHVLQKEADKLHKREAGENSEGTKGYNELFEHGLNVLDWLLDSDSVPVASYLNRAPISYPMIGLTSLLNYLICVRNWEITPAEVASHFKGITGHSQGILGAVVFAVSKTENELVENILQAVKFLFWIGVRLQQAVTFPTKISAQRTDILKESKKIHGSRNPTPMMAVFHLLPEVVAKYVDYINKMFADEPDRKLEIGLKNGPRAVVVVGHPESLHRLSVLLNEKETRKEDQLDQSRVPFSKRKREFRLVYLPVSAPFHSTLLRGAVNLVKEDINHLKEHGGSFWAIEGKDLMIPVYSTKDGQDLSLSGKELISQLIELQCTEYVDWLKATERISRTNHGITHVIDFGPGGSSGPCNFTSKNLEGSGVQFIMAGAFEPIGRKLFVADKACLFDTRKENIPFAPNWEEVSFPLNASFNKRRAFKTYFSILHSGVCTALGEAQY